MLGSTQDSARGEGLIMTHQALDEHRTERGHSTIVASHEGHRSLGRQLVTSVGGMLALLAIGLVVLLVVLWKAP